MFSELQSNAVSDSLYSSDQCIIEGEDIEMAWAQPEYSRKEVDLAGQILVSKASTQDEKDRALEVVNNWRSCHGFPLNTFQVNLRRNAGALVTNSDDALIAQRIKRLPAIVHKLDRLKRLKLSEFQDIGGCRAIMADIDLVRQLRLKYGQIRQNHILLKENDYIASPRKTGYRGIHLVYSYQSARSEKYNDLKIEIQLRSQLQHAWATAVETVGLFSSQYLKSNLGDKEWLRFFVLMSAIIAHKENAAPVPGTPGTKQALVEELKSLNGILKAREKLKAYGSALKLAEPKYGVMFLLHLDTIKEKLTIYGFKKNETLFAQHKYMEAEKETVGNPGVDVVLVSVDSVKSLRSAFPNYYLDTHRFVSILDGVLRS